VVVGGGSSGGEEGSKVNSGDLTVPHQGRRVGEGGTVRVSVGRDLGGGRK
jgi:hypothetical protein